MMHRRAFFRFIAAAPVAAVVLPATALSQGTREEIARQMPQIVAQAQAAAVDARLAAQARALGMEKELAALSDQIVRIIEDAFRRGRLRLSEAQK